MIQFCFLLQVLLWITAEDELTEFYSLHGHLLNSDGLQLQLLMQWLQSLYLQDMIVSTLALLLLSDNEGICGRCRLCVYCFQRVSATIAARCSGVRLVNLLIVLLH